MDNLKQTLKQQFGKQFKSNLPLKNLTTLKIGGEVKYFLELRTLQELKKSSQITNQSKIDWYVMGEGSNIVASDAGFAGLIIKIRIQKLLRQGNLVTVGAGNNLLDFIWQLDKLGLQGLEKMAGIPGSVGGAIYGNAGAYGQEINHKLIKVKIFDSQITKFRWLSKAQCQFKYRDSIFKKKKNWIICQAQFLLEKGDSTLEKISKEIIKLRQKKYRPGLLCPGSFFKNIVLKDLKLELAQQLSKMVAPEKIKYGKLPAGHLLEEVGAKGKQIGGIRVADHHGNLFYNTGKGSASDIRQLSVLLKAEVKEKFGIELEEEIQYLGF